VLQEVWIISGILGLMCASACGSAEQAQSGETSRVSFELILGDLEIEAVGFTVEGGDLSSPLQGRFDVHDGQDPPVWATIIELAPGDYTIALEAFDPSGQIICAGSKDFMIVSDDVTKVDVLLLCSGVKQGDAFEQAAIDAALEVKHGNSCTRGGV
jgi:hypothetical protein